VQRRISTFLGLLLIGLVAVAPASGLEIQSIVRAAAQYQNANPHLQTMFRTALLDTTKLAEFAPDGTAYVKTGDIPAEWLRDASAQVRPYLYYAKNDAAVRGLLRAIIARQAKYLQIDPYANAFTLDYRVWEEKYELDSLAYPVTLAWSYWHETGDASIFTADERKAFDTVVATMAREQNHARFSRYTHAQLAGGQGRPTGYTGMIWTGFRPSDDACYYNYLIPSEMFAVVALGDLAQIEARVYHDDAKAALARKLRDDVRRGIQKYGMVTDKKYGKIYAYEVDGLGKGIVTDDANVPSLLSAPYIGYTGANNPDYLNTRAFLLSQDNASYYTGSVARGIGSYHTPDHWVWPLALVMEGLTANSPTEKQDVLNQLLASDPGDHLLHESFDPNDPKRYTRADFGWPNALFSEYVMTSFDGVSLIPMGEPST
jgi:meiotically up-regulated gene 157 (Mug157) protein